MPAAAKGAPPTEPEPPTPAAAAALPAPVPDAAPAGRLEPGVYEYTAPFATVYHLPLTAHPRTDDSPATVFHWLAGAPADGRWAPTRKKPNQEPDNAGPATAPEV